MSQPTESKSGSSDAASLSADSQDEARNSGESALDRYQSYLGSIESQRDALRAVDRRYLTIRTVLFFSSVCLLALGYFSSGPGWIVWLGWCVFGGFFVAVVLNEPVRDKIDQLGRSRKMAMRLIARVRRDWDQLVDPFDNDSEHSLELSEHEQAAADDLDLLGRASLFQLVSMASTAPGIRTLAHWLTGPADREAACSRRKAVQTLAPKREERLRFYSLAREVGESSGNPDRFVNWSSGKAWLEGRGWLLAWSNVSAAIAVLLVLWLLAAVVGAVDPSAVKVSIAALVGLATLNFLLTAALLGPVHEIFSIAMTSQYSVDNYRELFASADWLPSDTAPNESVTVIRETLTNEDNGAARGMRDLASVSSMGALRQTPSTFILYLPLQAFGLWDVRVLKRLEAWQAKYKDHVREWFDSLGQLEALLSVAAVHDENPRWVFPEWVDEASSDACVAAHQVGHPLLQDDERVCNDVSIGPAGTVLLVTGSNMSGKSTLLRSLGLNISLAASGAPVCANSFSLPSLELATSIRVSDNLSAGVSFYMAELQRLKGVVDRARVLAEDESRLSLFLLDEILQGTNSRERQIAVVQVLRHLMNSKAIGAISTHDLELADEDELVAVAQTVHFRETIEPDAEGNEKMTFDYKMREGVSPTTNALRLLEMVGLGE